MSRIRCAVLFGALVVASAVMASTASAEAPEFGRCVKKAGGKYETSHCDTEEAGKNKFEWEPGPGAKPGFAEALSSGTLFMSKRKKGEEVECTGESATGEYAGPKTVSHVDIVLTGCFFDAHPSGTANCETVVLAPLKGAKSAYTQSAKQRRRTSSG